MDFTGGSNTGIYCDILGQVSGRLAAGVALCKAFGARLPGGGLLFYEEKQAKDF